MTQAFRLIKDRVIGGACIAKAGDTLYRYPAPDYGCSADDTRATGVKHWSMTFSPEGAYPFFTVPTNDLKAAPE